MANLDLDLSWPCILIWGCCIYFALLWPVIIPTCFCGNKSITLMSIKVRWQHLGWVNQQLIPRQKWGRYKHLIIRFMVETCLVMLNNICYTASEELLIWEHWDCIIHPFIHWCINCVKIIRDYWSQTSRVIKMQYPTFSPQWQGCGQGCELQHVKMTWPSGFSVIVLKQRSMTVNILLTWPLSYPYRLDLQLWKGESQWHISKWKELSRYTMKDLNRSVKWYINTSAAILRNLASKPSGPGVELFKVMYGMKDISGKEEELLVKTGLWGTRCVM